MTTNTTTTNDPIDKILSDAHTKATAEAEARRLKREQDEREKNAGEGEELRECLTYVLGTDPGELTENKFVYDDVCIKLARHAYNGLEWSATKDADGVVTSATFELLIYNHFTEELHQEWGQYDDCYDEYESMQDYQLGRCAHVKPDELYTVRANLYEKILQATAINQRNLATLSRMRVNANTPAEPTPPPQIVTAEYMIGNKRDDKRIAEMLNEYDMLTTHCTTFEGNEYLVVVWQRKPEASPAANDALQVGDRVQTTAECYLPLYGAPVDTQTIIAAGSKGTVIYYDDQLYVEFDDLAVYMNPITRVIYNGEIVNVLTLCKAVTPHTPNNEEK